MTLTDTRKNDARIDALMDGHRKCKRIPGNAKAAVERLVRAGDRYRALEREYRVRLTELALADGGKKNA